MNNKDINNHFGKKVIASTLALSLALGGGAAGFAERENDLNGLIMEWEEAGIDANHTQTVENILAYIRQNVPDLFASVHIDREKRPLGIIVLSLTEEVSADTKKEIEALLEEDAQVTFRVVKYTEAELLEKQQEMDQTVFQSAFHENFAVYHTGTDVINNKVEVGIDPYTDENAEVIYEQFGRDMVTVVQGFKMQPLSMEESAEDESALEATTQEVTTQAESPGFFSRLVTWFKSLFS